MQPMKIDARTASVLISAAGAQWSVEGRRPIAESNTYMLSCPAQEMQKIIARLRDKDGPVGRNLALAEECETIAKAIELHLNPPKPLPPKPASGSVRPLQPAKVDWKSTVIEIEEVKQASGIFRSVPGVKIYDWRVRKKTMKPGEPVVYADESVHESQEKAVDAAIVMTKEHLSRFGFAPAVVKVQKG